MLITTKSVLVKDQENLLCRKKRFFNKTIQNAVFKTKSPNKKNLVR